MCGHRIIECLLLNQKKETKPEITCSHCRALARFAQGIVTVSMAAGPKLYEANWLDLTRARHIANVQCVEVWCPIALTSHPAVMKRMLQHVLSAGPKLYEANWLDLTRAGHIANVQFDRDVSKCGAL
jgi:superfamily II DNA or RNA helicase